jgi:hypothetical protein
LAALAADSFPDSIGRKTSKHQSQADEYYIHPALDGVQTPLALIETFGICSGHGTVIVYKQPSGGRIQRRFSVAPPIAPSGTLVQGETAYV